VDDCLAKAKNLKVISKQSAKVPGRSGGDVAGRPDRATMAVVSFETAIQARLAGESQAPLFARRGFL
jgi:hypothetical protein